MTTLDKPSELADALKPPRQQRVGRYKVWLLQKKLAELSSQVEASVLEARQLIAWKQSYQPLSVAELTEEDRRILEQNHRIRLVEVVQKHCTTALKSIVQHKWAFPFNSPVDTSRFPDYPKVVTHPMDFSTIKVRQDSGYYRDPKDWWNDVMLIFSNAKRYNAPGSDCYLMAQTLQEVSEEKYDKVIAPRLAEEAATLLREEMHLKKRRAELLNLQISEAMEAQCAMLFSLMAELHAAIREAKVLASSLCEPLTLEEKQALAATIQGLPTAQLESIVAFVASRHPPSVVSHSEVPPGSAAPSRKVQLNLGRYDPLLLRQLQHLVSTCTATRQQQQQQQPGVAGAAQQGVQPQRAASPPAAGPAAVKAATAAPASTTAERARSGSGSPSPGPGQAAAANGPAPAAANALTQSPEAEGPIPGAAVQEAPSGREQSVPLQQQQSAAGAAGQAESSDAAAAPAAARPSSGGGAAPGPTAAAPPPLSSMQRNISDVVTNATAAGISMRAGIKWPGLAVGAGVRPRARAVLALHPDGPASAAELVAACPLPQPPPVRTTVQVSGVKRRPVHLLQVDEGEQRRAPAPGSDAARQEARPRAQEGMATEVVPGPNGVSFATSPAAEPGPNPIEAEVQVHAEAIKAAGQDAVMGEAGTVASVLDLSAAANGGAPFLVGSTTTQGAVAAGHGVAVGAAGGARPVPGATTLVLDLTQG